MNLSCLLSIVIVVLMCNIFAGMAFNVWIMEVNNFLYIWKMVSRLLHWIELSKKTKKTANPSPSALFEHRRQLQGYCDDVMGLFL